MHVSLRNKQFISVWRSDDLVELEVNDYDLATLMQIISKYAENEKKDVWEYL